jgi:hypothetical protein
VSWTQGLQERADLPATFLKWADDKLGEPVLALVWDAADPERFTLMGETKAIELRLAR